MSASSSLRNSVLIGIGIGIVACDDPVSHVYRGHLYLEQRGCVATESTIDIVSGADPGSCPPVCLVARSADARSVYVGTSCPPFPPDYDSTGKDPACAPAIAAFQRDDECNADGGSTHPIADAGTD
jgi:hypothetical protein